MRETHSKEFIYRQSIMYAGDFYKIYMKYGDLKCLNCGHSAGSHASGYGEIPAGACVLGPDGKMVFVCKPPKGYKNPKVLLSWELISKRR